MGLDEQGYPIIAWVDRLGFFHYNIPTPSGSVSKVAGRPVPHDSTYSMYILANGEAIPYVGKGAPPPNHFMPPQSPHIAVGPSEVPSIAAYATEAGQPESRYPCPTKTILFTHFREGR